MKEEYIKFWNDSVKHSSKLEFYREIKISYAPEPFLEIIRSFNKRRNIIKFRISNHNLAIEAGRYTKTAVNNRLYLFWPLQTYD